MRNSKNLWLLVVIIIISMGLFGCGKNNSTDPDKPSVEGTGQITGNEVLTLEEPIGEPPIMLTSIGQSADFEIAKTLLDRLEIKYEHNIMAKAEDLSDIKTLVLAVGGSSKGLGAAGINPDDEMNRAEKLLAAAKEKGITIITLHTGGQSRRGELSDRFINAVVPSSDYIVVVSDGNKDGLFTRLAQENNIPLDIVDSIAQTVEPLRKAFK